MWYPRPTFCETGEALYHWFLQFCPSIPLCYCLQQHLDIYSICVSLVCVTVCVCVWVNFFFITCIIVMHYYYFFRIPPNYLPKDKKKKIAAQKKNQICGYLWAPFLYPFWVQKEVLNALVNLWGCIFHCWLFTPKNSTSGFSRIPRVASQPRVGFSKKHEWNFGEKSAV